MAATLTELVVGDEAEAWQRAGFDVVDDTVVVGSVAIRLVGADDTRSIRSWAFTDGPPTAVDRVDGIPTAVADRPAPSGDHPNGAVAIDHVVVLSPRSDRTIDALASLGIEPRRSRDTDQYGLPMRQTFFRSGEVIIELIAPLEGTDDGPASFFGLAYTVEDLDATVASLGDDIGAPKDAVQEGRRIATLRHKNLGLSVPTAFMSPPPR